MRIDLSGSIRRALDETLRDARAKESGGDGASAAAEYVKAAKLMSELAEAGATQEDRKRRLRKAEAFLRKATLLKGSPRRRDTSRIDGHQGVDGGSPKSPAAAPPEGDAYAAEVLAMIRRTAVEWDDIGGLEATKAELQFTFGLSAAQRPAGTSGLGWRRVLLYGPPGTGKTLLAAAASSSLDATFFDVRTNSVLSKYFGESSRILSAVFAAARSEADEGLVVLFFDEVDALARTRAASGESGAERRLLATLLAELDGLSEKGDDRFVMSLAATNAPWDLDDAILSRFEKRIHIPFPDESARLDIVKRLLAARGLVSAIDLSAISSRTEFFSGRDLGRVVSQAASLMLERENSGLASMVQQGIEAIRGHSIKIAPLAEADFMRSLERVRVDRKRQEDLAARFEAFAAEN